MNRRFRFTIAFLGLLAGSLLARADLFFAEGWWLNARILQEGDQRIVAESSALWAGGNVGSYPEPGYDTPSVTFNDGQKSVTVRLEQSAFGQMVAGPLGFPDAGARLKSDAFALLKASAAYATDITLNGEIQKAEGAWDIRFPGVIDPATGTDFGTTGQNYFEEKNRAAAARYRAALTVNPFDAEAARGLLLCYYQRMVPLTFAGNNAFVRASRQRIVGENPAIEEIALLENSALRFYEAAAAEMVALAAQPVDASLVDGSHPFIPASAVADQVNRFLDAFARALALQGETLIKVGRLKEFIGYQDPTIVAYNPADLLAFLDAKIAGLQQQLLLANMFAGQPAPAASELSKAMSLVEELRRLRSSTAEGRLAFVGVEVSQAGGQGTLASTHREYEPEYVPFLFDPVEFSQYPNSFQKLAAEAEKLAGRAELVDGQALSSGREFDGNGQILKDRFRQIRDRYYGELGTLCGLIRDDQGELLPDILLALLPAEDRDRTHTYTGGESKGSLYQQWRRVTLAETELQAANLDLQNVVSNMRKKEEIAQQIAGNITQGAELILANGEKVAALDQVEGEVRAETAKAAARLGVQRSIRGQITDTVMAGQSGASAGAQTGSVWGAVAGAVVGTVNAVFERQEKVQNALAMGELEAGLARRLAEIQAQKTRIAAAERAQLQYLERDNTLLRTEEALHALVLEAERLKLNLLMAEQKLDMEMLDLANMTGRVRFLLQEYASALQLEQTNPLGSPDYRLLRDLAARDAEETFIFAQEALYKAAKAGQYKINGGDQAVQAAALLHEVLAARNGRRLVTLVNYLRTQIDRLYEQHGAQDTVQATLSLRHDVFQNNAVTVTNELTGEFDRSDPLALEPQAGDLSSDAAWLRFLRDHIVTDLATGEHRLEFTFSTSLNRRLRNGRNVNQLYQPGQFNALIFYHPTLESGFGVRVNFRGRGLALNSEDQIQVELQQEGASYIRSKPARLDAEGTAVRVWNLEPLPGRAALVIASVNGFKEARTGTKLHERSPANDRWIFSMSEDIPGNAPIFDQLDKLNDIQLRFSVRGFTATGAAAAGAGDDADETNPHLQ